MLLEGSAGLGGHPVRGELQSVLHCGLRGCPAGEEGVVVGWQRHGCELLVLFFCPA